MADVFHPIDTLYQSASRLAAMRPALLGECRLTGEMIEGLYHSINDAETEIRAAIAALESNNDNPEGNDPGDGDSAPQPSTRPRLHLVASRHVE